MKNEITNQERKKMKENEDKKNERKKKERKNERKNERKTKRKEMKILFQLKRGIPTEGSTNILVEIRWICLEKPYPKYLRHLKQIKWEESVIHSCPCVFAKNTLPFTFMPPHRLTQFIIARCVPQCRLFRMFIV